jgi:REP element-mobilizing transposase RayT
MDHHLMATPRAQLVDEAVTPWYHCVSRCVRKAFLCGQGAEHRKRWIEQRLQFLASLFSIDCGGFAVMDNHLHLLLRLDSQRAQDWTPQEVARRWLTLFPLRDLAGKPLPVADARVQERANDADWISKTRKKLSNLGWFMKCLKEPLSRLANKEDGCTGAFWEGRYRSVAILDEEHLLATAAYIDLNPLAAGVAPTPEASQYTSFHTRIEHARAEGSLPALRDDLSTLTRNPEQERRLWLLPTDDARDRGEARAGLAAGCTLSCYVRLIDWTSRLIRAGKAHLDPASRSLFERLRLDPKSWEVTISQLVRSPKRGGSHFGTRARLSEVARIHGRRWHRNQLPRPPARAVLTA